MVDWHDEVRARRLVRQQRRMERESKRSVWAKVEAMTEATAAVACLLGLFVAFAILATI